MVIKNKKVKKTFFIASIIILHHLVPIGKHSEMKGTRALLEVFIIIKNLRNRGFNVANLRISYFIDYMNFFEFEKKIAGNF